MLRTLKQLLLLLALCGLCLPSAIYAAMKAARFPLAWSVPALPERAVIDNSPDGRFAVYRYIHERVPEKSLSLSFRPWDFLYYANRPLLHPDDPRMAAFYASKDAIEAWRTLAGLGVDYLCLPSNELPAEAGKRVSWLIGDPSLTELVFEKDYNRIYKILRMRCPAQPLASSGEGLFNFGDKALWSLEGGLKPKADGRALVNASGGPLEASSLSGSALFEPGDKCLLKGSLAGSGQLSIVAVSSPSGARATVWSGRLSPGWQEISSQFYAPPKDSSCSLAFVLGPEASCEARGFKVERYGKLSEQWSRTPSDLGSDPFLKFMKMLDSYKHALSNLM